MASKKRCDENTVVPGEIKRYKVEDVTLSSNDTDTECDIEEDRPLLPPAPLLQRQMALRFDDEIANQKLFGEKQAAVVARHNAQRIVNEVRTNLLMATNKLKALKIVVSLLGDNPTSFLTLLNQSGLNIIHVRALRSVTSLICDDDKHSNDRITMMRMVRDNFYRDRCRIDVSDLYRKLHPPNFDNDTCLMGCTCNIFDTVDQLRRNIEALKSEELNHTIQLGKLKNEIDALLAECRAHDTAESKYATVATLINFNQNVLDYANECALVNMQEYDTIFVSIVLSIRASAFPPEQISQLVTNNIGHGMKVGLRHWTEKDDVYCVANKLACRADALKLTHGSAIIGPKKCNIPTCLKSMN